MPAKITKVFNKYFEGMKKMKINKEGFIQLSHKNIDIILSYGLALKFKRVFANDRGTLFYYVGDLKCKK